VAELMGIPLGTVLSRMHRSRQQLRQSLADSPRRNEFGGPPTQDGRDQV
jgi:DNA-directed RNA polymerase specialized sigma24 family protein